ncbi:MAG: sensor domain-containing diguanylate cyclase [Christensenella sp.]|nr:sensor domain-containing diguanylate cyclase [Christensenella sp.]
MIKKLRAEDSKPFLLSLLFVFLAVSLLFLIATMLIQEQSNRVKRLEIDISERSLIASEEYFVNYKINRLTSDLQFIYDTLEQNDIRQTDLGDIETLWRAYSNSRKVYDQIRFLNTQGDELIRVDYSKKGAVILPKDQLQNKKDRYYFQKTIEMDPGQSYMSPLDLNIENGAIELPINPVIRLAQPYFDSAGVKQGIIVLNYSASDILTQIDSIASGSFGEVYLLNKDSFWLYHSKDSYKEWAFAYNPNSTVRFSDYYAKEWGMISAGGSGTMTTENGYFNYATIVFDTTHTSDASATDQSCDIGSWYIVSFIPRGFEAEAYPSSDLGSLALSSLHQYAIFYITILLFSAVLAAFITISRTKSRQVKFFSEFDVMTNAYNRHAGIDKLAELYKSLSKNNCSMSICFIDVNGLKQVNDTLGHEVGDELIITVAKTICMHIRENDFLIRLGGDEFLIVFQGIDEMQAENAWSRIVAEFETINNTEQRKYLISVSHGIMMLNCTLNQMLDNVLNQADLKMYEEKRRIKSDVQIIRE